MWYKCNVAVGHEGAERGEPDSKALHQILEVLTVIETLIEEEESCSFQPLCHYSACGGNGYFVFQ